MPAATDSTEARERFERRRIDGPKATIGGWKMLMRERVARTIALVGWRGLRGDMHMHTNHSDGAGTADDIAYFRERAGLDFVFVTDHYTVAQKDDCARNDGVWLGQESATGGHHLVVLGLDRLFVCENDIADDFHAARELGAAAWFPHPTGWFPTKRYTEEQVAALDRVGPRFAIEIINGAGQIFDCWDETDEMAVALWDRHLAAGREVVAVGNTDAHVPHAVGDVWNGVLADERSPYAVMDAVRDGALFVSDAPIVNIGIEAGGLRAGMGEAVSMKGGSPPPAVRLLAADSAGLRSARLIRDGREAQVWRFDGDAVFETTWTAPATDPQATYYRFECRAIDGRRAYTNPVYIRPQSAPVDFSRGARRT